MYFILLSVLIQVALSSTLAPALKSDPVQILSQNDCDIDVTALMTPNTSLSVSDRAQLAYVLVQCHWTTLDRPWVQICNSDVYGCLTTLPDVALADWILHWTLVSKAERHVKATLRDYTTRVMSIDGERMARDISHSQEQLSHQISALVDSADHLGVKHSLFAAQFTELMTRLTPLRALVQSMTRAVTHFRTIIDALSAHHTRLVYLFWIVRTVLMTRVLRIPFHRMALCIGEESRVKFSWLTDGLLFVQLFVLYPLLHVQLSLTIMLILYSVCLLVVYLHRVPLAKQVEGTVPNTQSDWSRANQSLYRQLKHCTDLHARVKLRREWTEQQCSHTVIRHLPGCIARDRSL